ncbi:hypothetical protein ACI65C_007755 [Semiaphis heraclei]
MIGRWIVGFVVFVGYLCLGAFVFYRIERKEEEFQHSLDIIERLELKELLAKHYTTINAHVRKQLAQQLNVYCNKTVLDEGPEEPHQYQWTYYNAFFFALTTLSTIGYGNLHPTSGTGRILVLVYSLIGIPLNGIVLTQLGSFFESRILRAHYSYKTQRMMGPQLSLILDIVTYLIPGIIVFIFLPAGLISYFEDWTFDESVYFTFVTLTTIGYGDYVAGQKVNIGIWYDAYKVFLVFWIMFGLGYLFMILSFISRAMRSKTLEHLFLERLKQTHSKIWHQFTKDVVYIRRVLNESYLLKFKPVYKKEALSRDQPLRRSRSAPNLTEWPVLCKVPVPVARRTSDDEDEETVRQRFEKHRMKRRRALSQNKMRSLLRRTKATSEIDLAHIDKEATFGADIASYEILSRVVDALETAVPNQPSEQPVHHHHLHPDATNSSKKKALSFSEGVQGFTNQDILASEKNEWTVGGDMLNRENPFGAKHRNSYFEYDTWGGGADDQNFKKFNDYSKHGNGGQNKPRVPKLRRMSAAAFNFLSNNIAPKWFADKLADGSGGGGGGHTWNDDPRHRLSLNDDQGYGYGSTTSTYNGTAAPINRTSAPVQYHHRGSHVPQVLHDTHVYGSSAPEHTRHRRLSSPDPVLAHCANTIAVADFLMTLQRSLDGASITGQQPPLSSGTHHIANQPAVTGGGFASVIRHERRSPLFTLFQDRPRRSSGESWQYSSLTSIVSSTSSTVANAATTPATDVGTINAVHEQPAATVTTRRSKKKRARRFSIRPTVGTTEPNGSVRCWTTTETNNTTTCGTDDDSAPKGRGGALGLGAGHIGAGAGDFRLNIED